MDWVISITTLLANAGLGWSKGKYWMWLLHAVNATLWIAYSYSIKQNGLILLSIVTVLVDLVSAYRAFRKG